MYVKLRDGTKIWYDIYQPATDSNGAAVNSQTLQTIVLNHGYGSSHKSLDAVARLLSKKYRVIVWDQRGQGDSDKKISTNYEEIKSIYSVQTIADDCYDLLTRLGVVSIENDNSNASKNDNSNASKNDNSNASKNDNSNGNELENINESKILMYGHSMGGMVSLLYSLRHPNTLEALAVGSTTCTGENEDWSQIFQQIKSGKITVDENYYRENAKNGFTEEFIAEHPEYIDYVLDDKFKTPESVSIALLDNFLENYRICESLKSLEIPVLLLHGKLDKTISPKFSEYMHKLLKNSELILFSNQAHEINKEIPETISEILDSYFTRQHFLCLNRKYKKNIKTSATITQTIDKLDIIMENILNLFGKIGTGDPDEDTIERKYCEYVGDFSTHLNHLLYLYNQNSQDRKLQLKYKPEILFYRQTQGYLVFILRFPDILKVRGHEEINQTIKFLANKEYLLKTLYNKLAEEQTELFEGSFREELEEKLRKMPL